MAEGIQKRPKKGILKNSSSFDKQEQNARKSKETKWDEMNIIATLHPVGKDYGHMKIAEPKTPYNYEVDDQIDGLDAKELAEKIRIGAEKPPKALMSNGSDDDDDDNDEDLTPEEKAKKREFELKRKKHYNEFYALQLAKKLMEEDEDDDEETSQDPSSSSGAYNLPN